MKQEFKGRVKAITQETKVSDNFTYKSVILEDGEGVLAIQFSNKNLDKANYAKVGDEVTITGYIQSREYNGNYYTSINGTYIKLENAAPAAAAAPAPEQQSFKDLPF